MPASAASARQSGSWVSRSPTTQPPPWKNTSRPRPASRGTYSRAPSWPSAPRTVSSVTRCSSAGLAGDELAQVLQVRTRRGRVGLGCTRQQALDPQEQLQLGVERVAVDLDRRRRPAGAGRRWAGRTAGSGRSPVRRSPRRGAPSPVVGSQGVTLATATPTRVPRQPETSHPRPADGYPLFTKGWDAGRRGWRLAGIAQPGVRRRAAVRHRGGRRPSGGPFLRSRAELARVQPAGPRTGRGRPDPAARAGQVPGHLRQQPGRVLHGPGRRSEAPDRGRGRGAGGQRAAAARGARPEPDPQPRADGPARGDLAEGGPAGADRAGHRHPALGRAASTASART